jgi:hypothetical protein
MSKVNISNSKYQELFLAYGGYIYKIDFYDLADLNKSEEEIDKVI